jgi:hypothetical protein
MSSQDSNSPRGAWSPGRAQSPHPAWPLDEDERSGFSQVALAAADRDMANYYGPRHLEMPSTRVSSEQVSQDERRVLRRRSEQAARRWAASAIDPVLESDQQLVQRLRAQQQQQHEQQQQLQSANVRQDPNLNTHPNPWSAAQDPLSFANKVQEQLAGIATGSGANSAGTGPEGRSSAELHRNQRDVACKAAREAMADVTKELAAFQKLVRDWEVDLPFGDDRLPRPHVTKAEERAISRAELAVGHSQGLIAHANEVSKHHRSAIESHCRIPPPQRGELGEDLPDPRPGEVRFRR